MVDMKTSNYVAPSATVELARGADLDVWAHHAWQNGVQVEDLWAGDELVIHTTNSTYEIRVIAPESREVIIRGGKFFPEPRRAAIDGSSLGGAFLKLGGIYVGFALEIRGDNGVIVTSRVRSVGFVQHG
jgi:hypothetical protein